MKRTILGLILIVNLGFSETINELNEKISSSSGGMKTYWKCQKDKKLKSGTENCKKLYNDHIIYKNKDVPKVVHKMASIGAFNTARIYKVNNNYSEMNKWYQKSIDAGNCIYEDCNAKNNLALSYFFGQGVAINKCKAFNLFLEAENSGNKTAPQALKELFHNNPCK